MITIQKDQHQQVQELIKSRPTFLKSPQKKKDKVFEVYMRCVTWTKDSHGLFDYESKNISKKNIKTHTGGKIILVGDEI